MYFGWQMEKTMNGNGNKKPNKYSALLGNEISEIGSLKKNNSLVPLYNIGGQLTACRSFGTKRISSPKLLELLGENKEITIIGGPCLFSRSELGIINSNMKFCSMATFDDREDILKETVHSLRIGESVTKYHYLHISFLEKLITNISNTTGIIPNINLIIPGIEYTAYTPKFWPENLKDEYWEKINSGSKKVADFYSNKLSPLGNLKIIRKLEWDVSPNGNNLPLDVVSYVKSYTANSNGNLVIAMEDIMDFPLVVEAGKHIPYLIGMLGILSQANNFFEKDEEIHPYLS